jgi:hypothetical protein
MMAAPSLVDRVLRLYPRQWRDRYGDELRDLVDELAEAGEFSKFRLAAGLIFSAVVQRFRSLRPTWKTVTGTVTVLAVVTVGVIVLTGLSPGRSGEPSAAATKGTVPSSTTHGTFDTKKIPDFIATLDRNGKLVGYIPRKYLFPSPDQPEKIGDIAPVYAANLKTLVGHMYPGVGFVPLGKSVQSLPCNPITFFGAVAGGSVTTSTAPCPIVTETVPNVVGRFTPTGVGMLQQAGVMADVENEHSQTVPGGHIVRTSPSAGARVPARTPVLVINSLGP